MMQYAIAARVRLVSMHQAVAQRQQTQVRAAVAAAALLHASWLRTLILIAIARRADRGAAPAAAAVCTYAQQVCICEGA
jgi:hypothetical protein